jgi:hypothetical protein
MAARPRTTQPNVDTDDDTPMPKQIGGFRTNPAEGAADTVGRIRPLWRSGGQWWGLPRGLIPQVFAVFMKACEWAS